jgi:hypothetical protein
MATHRVLIFGLLLCHHGTSNHDLYNWKKSMTRQGAYKSVTYIYGKALAARHYLG